MGLGTALVVYVAVSLATRPTDPAVLALWQSRLSGQDTAHETDSDTDSDTPTAPGNGADPSPTTSH